MNGKQLPLFFCLGIFWFLTLAKPAFAATIWQDDFESGTLQNWQVTRNQQWQNPNQPCEWHAQAASWQNNGHQAGIELYSNPCITELVAKNLNLSGKPRYIVRFDWSFPESTEMDRSFVFAWQNPLNFYALKQFGTQLKIVKVVNGQEVALPTASATNQFVANEAYHFDLDVQLGQKIVISVNQQPVLSSLDTGTDFLVPTDTTTIALQASTGALPASSQWFDNVIVEVPEETNTVLSVIPWKQADPLWGNQEYDHAKQWSDNPTMARWGCAVTSVASVLRYYGITQLPNKQPLTPASLNTWLNNQPDGYLGEGNLNWLAISRLTQLVSARLKTPKLEYAKLAGDQTLAEQQILQKRPVILEIPGHFLIGKGVTVNQKLVIHDPAFAYTEFEEHHQELLSVRQFTPSHTDLSYMLFTAPVGTTVEVRDSTGKLVSKSSTEQLKDDNSGQLTNNLKIVEVRQPTEGNYQVTIENDNPDQKGQVNIFTYDQEANLSQQIVTASQAPSQKLNVAFRKHGTSTVSRTMSWPLLRRQIELMLKRQAFLRRIIGQELLLALTVGEHLPGRAQRQFIDSLQFCWRANRLWIKADEFQELDQQFSIFSNQLKK